MTDIVERINLRNHQRWSVEEDTILLGVAADEIMRLRNALQSILETWEWGGTSGEMFLIARAALEGK